MGRGDKKSKQGKRRLGSYGNSRNRKKIKAQLKRAASKKPAAVAAGEKPKAKKTVKKKED
ncbi:MAG: 30S ribosomal protein THX [Bacteroidetes bacterium]|nr:30S ribosomal protein THX [Bacteroidota bacterium]MBS1539539.1 30S ribosomal protein THX [Bacteroidota bacterium]